MRSVNANLLEINQAKSRINQAKKEGTTPDPKDLELVKTEKQNAFAISQYTDIMTIEKFAKHIRSEMAAEVLPEMQLLVLHPSSSAIRMYTVVQA